MPYNNNYNKNGHRGQNGNYRPNNRNNNYNNRNNNNFNSNNFNGNDNSPYQRNIALDLRKYKKENIDIMDMNGKVYTINGNFSTEFSFNLLEVGEKVFDIKHKIENASNESERAKYCVELFHILKDWCLDFINMNIYGDVYTMTDVNLNFNDVEALNDLFQLIISKAAIQNKQENASK